MSGTTDSRKIEQSSATLYRGSVISPQRLKKGDTWRALLDDEPNLLREHLDSIQSGPVDFYRAPVGVLPATENEDTAPLQIWEGVVQDVDLDEGVMNAILNAKLGEVPRHIADIDMQWVSDQDKDLIEPGAVFYLTLFKLTKKGGSIQNSQELRFRRRPSWSASQLSDINDGVAELHAKMKALPIAE